MLIEQSINSAVAAFFHTVLVDGLYFLPLACYVLCHHVYLVVSTRDRQQIPDLTPAAFPERNLLLEGDPGLGQLR